MKIFGFLSQKKTPKKKLYEDGNDFKWRQTENNPFNNKRYLKNALELTTKTNYWLVIAIGLVLTLTVLVVLHLFFVKQKENIVFQDGTISSCVIEDFNIGKQ